MNKFNLIALSALMIAGSVFGAKPMTQEEKVKQYRNALQNQKQNPKKSANVDTTKVNKSTQQIKEEKVKQYKNALQNPINQQKKQSQSRFSTGKIALALAATSLTAYGAAAYFGYVPSITGKVFEKVASVTPTCVTNFAKNASGKIATCAKTIGTYVVPTLISNYAASYFTNNNNSSQQ